MSKTEDNQRIEIVGEVPTALLFEMRRRGYPHVHAIYNTGKADDRKHEILVFINPEKCNPNRDFVCLAFIEEKKGDHEGLVLEEVPICELKGIGEFIRGLF